MEGAGKVEEMIRVKKEDLAEKCPKFDGNKEEYQQWREKVENWMWKHKKLGVNSGFKLRVALKGQIWTLVAGLPKEQLAIEEGVEKVLNLIFNQ